MITIARGLIEFIFGVATEVAKRILLIAAGFAFIIIGIVLTIILAFTR